MSRDNPRRIPPDAQDFKSSETEKRTPEVQIGQLFSPFPKGLTSKKTYADIPYAEYDSDVPLVAPTGQRVNFTSYAHSHGDFTPYQGSHIIITPFQPEAGYQIDSFDFDDEDTGRYKYQQWVNQVIFPATNPLVFWVSHKGDGADKRTSEETYQSLEGLQLQMFANGLLFQSDIKWSNSPDENKIDFMEYYPSDTGPLPYVPFGGFELFLPDDIDKLRTIQARFMLPSTLTKK